MRTELVEPAPAAMDLASRFGVSSADIEAKRAQYEALDARADYPGVVKAIADCRTTRVEVEKRRKSLKADAIEYGRRVDRIAREFTELVESIEDPLKVKKQLADDEKERAKAEKARQERAENDLAICLAQWLADGALEWQRRIDAVEEERRRAARKAEEARLEAERKELELERARLEAERRKAEELARMERERLETERREREAAARAAREREEARLAAERAEIEAERRAAAEERRKADEARRAVELEEAKRQARIQAEREAAERAERERADEERRRIEEAERQQQERARLEALRPDMEKLLDYAAAVRAVPVPEVDDDEATDALAHAEHTIAVALYILEGFVGRKAAE